MFVVICRLLGRIAQQNWRSFQDLRLIVNEDETVDGSLVAIDSGVFLSCISRCDHMRQCLPLSTQVVEKNGKALPIHVMAEGLQLELQSNIYAADWSSLERMALFFKIQYEGKTKLPLFSVEKHLHVD